MTIDEAKRIIGNIKRCDIPKEETAKWEALDLGIEALKRFKVWRGPGLRPTFPGFDTLPGETEE